MVTELDPADFRPIPGVVFSGSHTDSRDLYLIVSKQALLKGNHFEPGRNIAQQTTDSLRNQMVVGLRTYSCNLRIAAGVLPIPV